MILHFLITGIKPLITSNANSILQYETPADVQQDHSHQDGTLHLFPLVQKKNKTKKNHQSLKCIVYHRAEQ